MTGNRQGFWLGITLLGLLIALGVQINSVRTVVVDALVQRTKEFPMKQELETKWKSGRIERSLKSTRGVDETEEEFILRHATAEARAFRQWPPD